MLSFPYESFNLFTLFPLTNSLLPKSFPSKAVPSKPPKRWRVWGGFSLEMDNSNPWGFLLFFPSGYTIANAAATVTATQLKQAVTMGQDLATYATYEAYPAFAVAARSDGYGAF